MKAQIELPDVLFNLGEIVNTLKDILNEIQNLRRFNADEWLTATDFCQKYHISRPTLYKRVKEGFIDFCYFDNSIKRYRLKSEVFNNGKQGTCNY